MFKNWSTLLPMRQLRHKYLTLLHRTTALQRRRILASMRRRIFKYTAITIVGLGAYYYGNQVYSERVEVKKMKRVLMKLYPEQTHIVSFVEDPSEELREVELGTGDSQALAAANGQASVTPNDQATVALKDHCIHLQPHNNPQLQALHSKLGDTVVIFAPRSMDELCHVIERCHKYRHSAVVGCYGGWQQVLDKAEEPRNKGKYVVVDLAQWREMRVDESNEVVEVSTGMACWEVNKRLEEQGYEPLFQGFCGDKTVHEVIVNNLPLEGNEMLGERVQNLSLVSAEGKRFKSATEVAKFGQIPNLTPLFLGTGGVFAVPALATVKLYRKTPAESQHHYQIHCQNLSELVLKWRDMKQHLSSHRTPFSLTLSSPSTLTISSPHPLPLPACPAPQAPCPDFIFSITPRTVQHLLLSPLPFPISISNNLLSLSTPPNPSHLHQLLSVVGGNGGVLVWCRDGSEYARIKDKVDLTEAGAELMKKIVEIREGIDRRHVLESHNRYEKYFAKGLFRRLTEFFW